MWRFLEFIATYIRRVFGTAIKSKDGQNVFEAYSQDDFGRDFEAIYDTSLIAKKDGEIQK